MPYCLPFFCGTYYPKVAFLQILSVISDAWQDFRAGVEEASEHIPTSTDELRSMAGALSALLEPHGGGSAVTSTLCD
ncbi:hypothetical protein [Mycobacterium leprae]|uniref:U1740g n=1 Tax=Mycobacterium leprae TaxID=1769 RepID=Q50063_MYCLR|nr:hypothetical protein [Mycobacterium leprae]AAA63021.1 u1740g [Mycobacterium leprae]OAR19851.1 hypothetical protein A8144_13365 [Mycobacterium leprae 3125609]OAX70190.1 hypothetical protein A3216_13400 [Mycobacterium leprae 7935681]